MRNGAQASGEAIELSSVQTGRKGTAWLRAILAGTAAFSLLLYCNATIPRLQTTTFDDAYMFLRYAKHWLAGMGLSWNPGEGPVYGITSLSYLLVVIGVRSLTKLPDPLVLTVISFCAGLASVGVLTALGFVFFKQLRRYWIPLLIAPGLVLGHLFASHSTSGMETTLALLSNSVFAAAVMLLGERRSIPALALSLAAGYAAYLTRPDSGLYWLLLPPLFLLAGGLRHARQALLYVAAVAIVLGADLLAKKAILGDALPLPFFSKAAGFHRGYIGAAKWNPAHEVFAFCAEALPYLIPMVCLTSRAALPRVLAICVPVLLTFAYFGTVTQIMGGDARYYYPSLPFLILGALIAADAYMEEGVRRPPRGTALRPLGAVAAVLALTVLTSPLADAAVTKVWRKAMIGEPTAFSARRRFAATVRVPSLGWWRAINEMDALLRQLPAGIVVACSECGFIGCRYPDLRVIDLAGLHDRHIARHGFSAAYLFSRTPDIIWLPHSDYTYARKEILDSQTFTENYDFYPNAYDYGLAVSRTSASAADIHKGLEKELARIYPGHAIGDYLAHPLARQ